MFYRVKNMLPIFFFNNKYQFSLRVKGNGSEISLQSHPKMIIGYRGIVCVKNYFVKSDLGLKPLCVERTFT